MIPTPTARDWKDTKGSSLTGINPDGSIRDRTDRVALWVYQKEQQEKGTVSGSLNPEWVEWLMGYPEGWTDCEGLETPSCRKSPPKSSDA